MRTPPEQRDLAAIETSKTKTTAAIKILDAQLAKTAYVAGDAFSMGDIPVGCFIHRWFALDIERPELKGLRAWYDRLATRPAYAKHVMVKLT